MSIALSIIAGIIVGLFFGAFAQNRIDDSHVQAGTMQHRGKGYLIIPVDAAERREWFQRRTGP